MVPTYAYLVLAVLVIVAAAGLMIREQVRSARIRRRLNAMTAVRGEEKFGWQDLLAMLAVPLARPRERARLADELAAAGLRRPWQLDLYLIGKLLFLLAVMAGGWIWLELRFPTLISAPLNSLKYLFMLFIAVRLPDWLLKEQISRRQAKIRASVPNAIDLMTICVESGVSLEDAFERVAREIEARAPEVASEFRATRSEMMVMDRTAALRRMEKRSGVREVETLADSLLQSMRYGTPLAEALRSIATDSRLRQVSELEEKAGKVSAGIGVPLVVFILFPLVALIAAPAVITLIRAF